jgi:hypothetical protein
VLCRNIFVVDETAREVLKCILGLSLWYEMVNDQDDNEDEELHPA